MATWFSLGLSFNHPELVKKMLRIATAGRDKEHRVDGRAILGMFTWQKYPYLAKMVIAESRHNEKLNAVIDYSFGRVLNMFRNSSSPYDQERFRELSLINGDTPFKKIIVRQMADNPERANQVEMLIALSKGGTIDRELDQLFVSNENLKDNADLRKLCGGQEPTAERIRIGLGIKGPRVKQPTAGAQCDDVFRSL